MKQLLNKMEETLKWSKAIGIYYLNAPHTVHICYDMEELEYNIKYLRLTEEDINSGKVRLLEFSTEKDVVEFESFIELLDETKDKYNYYVDEVYYDKKINTEAESIVNLGMVNYFEKTIETLEHKIEELIKLHTIE